ncbi:vWA domain-containing protein [Anaeromicropila populeti]|uniref:Ca-activated chloride channel family protein n=1 Tax=Anaeromicropila populeti TaxID=37658 RepID=A0A1I6JPD9_9FIRM|nr:VWA domain-containing protein [Anaeromicropila populeti]SFR80839.1 Ca-activated chloride channel family protein [Anaeromicropila populeti]
MKNKYIAFIAIGIFSFLALYVGLTVTKNWGKTSSEISTDTALKKLEKMVDDVDPQQVEARKANVQLGGNNLEEELPSIDKYPLSVTANTKDSIEIFVSTEKGGTGNDGWLNDVAEAFNKEKIKVNGKTASVSIRSIASGMAMDYIVSGKYLPDAFSPSNELWGAMIENKGVAIQLEEKKLAGNVAGILLSKKKQEELIQKYGEITIKTIAQATAESEIAMGYTNPFASSTGLNFLISTLCAYDETDPLSIQAMDGFESFQLNVPFVAYTTLQMREAVESGVLDGLIMEYQTYKNSTDLKKYEFTPFGVRHDNPIYSVGKLSEQKQAILKEFISYCLNDANQKLADKYGFNQLDTYKSDLPEFSGDILIEAQDLWKESKDSGRPVTAVFVADTSGSMDGEPLMELKNSLINGAEYINSDNYIGLVTYNSSVSINLPIAKFDLNQRSLFTGAVTDMSAAGGTATYDGVLVAMDMLLKAKETNPDTKLMMFVLSDGETNEGYKLKSIKGILKALEIPVYTIGYNADIEALETLSQINEAASINADSDDVVYKLKSLFNAQM